VVLVPLRGSPSREVPAEAARLTLAGPLALRPRLTTGVPLLAERLRMTPQQSAPACDDLSLGFRSVREPVLPRSPETAVGPADQPADPTWVVLFSLDSGLGNEAPDQVQLPVDRPPLALSYWNCLPEAEVPVMQ
jgi:hypothetical protein